MAKFHINVKGNPGVCNALISCPFGDLESDHYRSKEEAMQAYEQQNAEAGIPLVASMNLSKMSQGPANKYLNESRGDLQEVFAALPADDNVSKKDLAAMASFLQDRGTNNNGFTIARDRGLSVGENQRASDRELLDLIPKVFGQKLASDRKANYAFRKFASEVTVNDLNASIAEVARGYDGNKNQLADSQFLKKIYAVDDSSNQIELWLNAKTGKTKVDPAKIKDYNQKLLAANAATRGYDNALKAMDASGFPRTWDEAQRFAIKNQESGKVDVFPRLKTVSLADIDPKNSGQKLSGLARLKGFFA